MNSSSRPFPSVECKLIGICGHAGSGKDTVASYIHLNHDNTWKLAFAKVLKQAAAKLFGLDPEDFDDREWKERHDKYWGVSPRQMAQFFGTEMVRETLPKLIPGIESDFWIHRLIMTLRGEDDSAEYDSDDVVVISDVRFQNEYDWIIAQGGIIIHLTRPGADGTVGIPGHASEAGIDFHASHQTYHLINDSTLEELYAQVNDVLKQANIYPLSNVDSF